MRTAVFSTRPYDREYLAAAIGTRHELRFLEPQLEEHTAVLARGCEAVCPFVNDSLSAAVLGRLHEEGVRFLALRSAGFNHVDLAAVKRFGIRVTHVPAYSPHAVAEHAVALILALNRKLVRASLRVREGNFTLDPLLGFDLHGKTAGVVGTGKIGMVAAKILHGFGCRVRLYDPQPNDACRAWGNYGPLDSLWRDSDVITLHCPLTTQTRHLVNESSLALMKPGVMLVNTSRGGLIDTSAVIEALKQKRIGYLGLDVYEEEDGLFFADHSGEVIQDDIFARLLTFPNVLITAHQAFFTREALTEIARVTAINLDEMERGDSLSHEIPPLRDQG